MSDEAVCLVALLAIAGGVAVGMRVRSSKSPTKLKGGHQDLRGNTKSTNLQPTYTYHPAMRTAVSACCKSGKAS